MPLKVDATFCLQRPRVAHAIRLEQKWLVFFFSYLKKTGILGSRIQRNIFKNILIEGLFLEIIDKHSICKIWIQGNFTTF